MAKTTKDKEIEKELLTEADRIIEDSTYSAKSHFEASQRWRNLTLYLGMPASILSALAGVSILKEYVLVAGILSVAVTSLTALLTFLNPNQKANAHLNAGNYYSSLKNRTRIFRNILLKIEPNLSDTHKELQRLAHERDHLNKTSPQPSREDFERARKGIEKGESRYSADSETKQ